LPSTIKEGEGILQVVVMFPCCIRQDLPLENSIMSVKSSTELRFVCCFNHADSK